MPYLKVVSRLHKSFILGLWGVDLIFSLQGLNKKGREFASGIMSGGRYVRILRMGSVFKPTPSALPVCTSARRLRASLIVDSMVEASGTAQRSRQGERHYITA